jgi:hypothetical protein
MEAEAVVFMAAEAEGSTGEVDLAVAVPMAVDGRMAVVRIAAGMARVDTAGEPTADEGRCRKVMATEDSEVMEQRAGQADLADAA